MNPGITEDTKLADLDLSVRLSNCLKNHDCVTVGDALRLTDRELLRTPNFGMVSLREWKKAIGLPEEQYYTPNLGGVSLRECIPAPRQAYPVQLMISLNFMKEDGTPLLAGDMEPGTEIILTQSNGTWVAKLKPPISQEIVIKKDCGDEPQQYTGSQSEPENMQALDSSEPI